MGENIEMLKKTSKERAYEARQKRWRKPLILEASYQNILDLLYEIQEDIYDITYNDNLDEELALLLDDEQEEEEFKLAFSILSTDVDKFLDDINDSFVVDWFDTFFVAIAPNNFQMYGYDEWEGDYFGLNSYEEKIAKEESQKKLEKITKKELLQGVSSCLSIFTSYVGIKNRYEGLKECMDILKGENNRKLNIIKQIDDFYKKHEEEIADSRKYFDWSEFDNMLKNLPQEVWLY